MFEQNRNALDSGDHNVAQIIDILSSSDTSDRVLLLGMLDIATAEVGVVIGHGHYNFVETKVIATQRLRLNFDGVLFGFTTPRVDLADTGDSQQSVSNHPVVQRLDLHERHLRSRDGVLIDLTEGSRHRIDLGLQPHRQPALGLVQTLGNELTHQVLVHRVVEDHRHHREVELRRGTDHLQVRHTHHRGLDRMGDELFHFDGRHPRTLNGHDDLIVGEIREGFNWKLHHDGEPAYDKNEQQSENEPTVVEKKVNYLSQGLSLTHGSLKQFGFDHERAAHHDLVAWPQPIHNFSFAPGVGAHGYGLRAEGGSIMGDEDNRHTVDVLQRILGYEDCVSCLRSRDLG